MKAGILFTGTGPIIILTSYDSLDHPELIEKLDAKGLKKFIAYELPVEKVKEKYGGHYKAVIGDLSQTDDLRVLDFNGHNVFYNFPFKVWGNPVYYEPKG
jgi:hypothetical protein